MRAQTGCEQQRARMVDRQLVAEGVRDPRVLAAMGRVPRERFVPDSLRDRAYDDTPLPIAGDQTISQPYIVAIMLEAAGIRSSDRALEVGAGSGYAAAVLGELAAEVFAIERIAALAESAGSRLAELGYSNVSIRHSDGALGWPEQAPFEVIIVSAAAEELPPRLIGQLAVGGRMIMPVGGEKQWQRLVRVRHPARDRYEQELLEPVRFVPLIRGEQ